MSTRVIMLVAVLAGSTGAACGLSSAAQKIKYTEADTPRYTSCQRVGNVEASSTDTAFATDDAMVGVLKERAAQLGGTNVNILGRKKSAWGPRIWQGEVYRCATDVGGLE